MSAYTLSLANYGDSAVMLTVAHPDEAIRRRTIREFRTLLLEDLPPGVDDVVSGLESLLVEFDPLLTSQEQLAYALSARSLHSHEGATPAGPVRELLVPLVVDPDTAPDLDAVAAELGLTAEAVIDRVVRSHLTVSLLAAAMAPMMDGLNVPRPVRRQSTPRTDVPAGSLMIAGRNAIIQPFPGPTGWRVIGRTPLTIVDITRQSPISFSPGDRMRFTVVSAQVAAGLAGRFLEKDTR
ncbi:5-oxoprolinase subunit B family protein [Luethyella okanaganae]|uniref:Allophanate hydrolase subunit 1 n=1 Tax=Luethyella okanaganae TaxID=69372 RepID=A0ABW1V9G4_9MICO